MKLQPDSQHAEASCLFLSAKNKTFSERKAIKTTLSESALTRDPVVAVNFEEKQEENDG